MTTDAGFLADLGLDSVEADPNHLPTSTYNGYVTDCKIVEAKDKSKGKFLVFTYKVSDGEHRGKTIDEWKSANAFDEKKKKSYLKQRILSLGVPEARLGSVSPEDLTGIAVRFTVKQKGEYTNVTFVALRDENEVSEDAVSPLAASVLDNL